MEFSPRSAYEITKEIGHSLLQLGHAAVLGFFEKVEDAMDVFGDEE